MKAPHIRRTYAAHRPHIHSPYPYSECAALYSPTGTGTSLGEGAVPVPSRMCPLGPKASLLAARVVGREKHEHSRARCIVTYVGMMREHGSKLPGRHFNAKG